MNEQRDRTARFRAISWYLAGLLLLCACWRLITPLAALVDPMWSTARLSCTPACSLTLDPVQLLDWEVRDRARIQVDMEQRISSGLEVAEVRAAIIGSRVLRAAPEVFFFLALGFAAGGFARSGIERRALAWLRRAMWSAVIWPVTGSVAHALNSWATMPMVSGQREVHIGIYPQDLVVGLLVAASLRLIIWALEEALTLRADSDEYV
jgi:hypothetical protein